VVSFAGRLEERSTSFYNKLAEQFPDHADIFRSCAREGNLNKVLLIRTYQETVTDALETGFSFEGLDLKDGVPEGVWEQSANLKEAVGNAIVLERAAVNFYADIAGRSQILLSTIYSAFKRVEAVRRNRLAKLGSLETP
jgi:rubrerythrin